MKKTTLFFLLIAISLATSCDGPDCIRTGSVRIRLGFYDLQEGGAAAIRINNLQILGSDSVLFDGVPDVSNIILPINPSADSITVFFDTELGSDTLTIGYKKIARLISEECGAEVVYKGLNIIRSDFDSVRVINSSTQINYLEPDVVNENIQVFN